MTYFSSVKASGENNVGYSAGCVNLWADGNYLMGGRPLMLTDCTIGSFTGNTFYGEMAEGRPPRRRHNLYYETHPTGTKVFVRPNRCEPGRASIAIYNWDSLPQVTVDLSKAGLVEGEPFVVQDVQNYFGHAVAKGTYDAKPVKIPMTGLRVEPAVGSISLSHTAPQFGAFVILQPTVNAQAGTSVPPACRPSDATAGPSNSPLKDFLRGLGV